MSVDRRSMVAYVRQIKAENRALKSKQIISGSTVVATYNDNVVVNVQLPAGTGDVNYVTVGTITLRLQGINADGNGVPLTYSPVMQYSGFATSEGSTLAGTPESGSAKFTLVPQSINGNVATLKFWLSHNYDMADRGVAVQVNVVCTGTGRIENYDVEYHHIVYN